MNISKNLLMPALFFSLLLFSCTPTQKLKYVTNKGETDKNEYFNDRSEKTIQPYDYLYIRIFSLDERTNSIFNERSSGMYQTELLSYSVDDKGNITLPFIGSVPVKDLTINQAKVIIEKSLANFLNNVSVVVRYVSNKITILGEVNTPGQFAFYDEKVTAFQALANGTNTFADLTNVTIIREKNNKISYHQLDLTQRNVVASEYYYLLPNDILILNPINAKYRSLRDYTLNILATVIGSLATLLSSITLYQSIK
jgi:polysaccharide export outer membrane protein